MSPPAKPGRIRKASLEPAATAADEIDAMTGDPNFMTSLARGLAVIRGFTQQKRA